MQHGETEPAVGLLTAFLAHSPSDCVGHELLAQGYKALEDYRAERRHLQRALESLEGDESAERGRLMNNIGVACASVGALDEAERWYKRALDTAPHPISFRNLFDIYSGRDDRRTASRLVKRWLDVFPDDDDGALHLAIQLAETDDVDRGISELRRLTNSGVAVRAYGALGYVVADVRGEMGAAMEILEEGYERFPRDAAIANNLGYGAP